MAPTLPLHHSRHLPTAEAHLGPGGVGTCCQRVAVTALMAPVILTDKMEKQTWQSFILCLPTTVSTDDTELWTSMVRRRLAKD